MGNGQDIAVGVVFFVFGVVALVVLLEEVRARRDTSPHVARRESLALAVSGAVAGFAVAGYYLLPQGGAKAIIGDVAMLAALAGLFFVARIARATKKA